MNDDLTGKRFGKLVVVGLSNERTADRRYIWVCRCDCGNMKNVPSRSLKKGITRSCGCLAKRNYDVKSRLYSIWPGIKARCNNPNKKCYKNYGGRGIKVCDEWEKDYKAFHDWAIANGYTDDLTIERIDVNKGYSPDNCMWITIREQSRNKRNSRWISVNGETKLIGEWEKELGLSQGAIGKRLKNGWSIEDACTKRRGEKVS